MSKRRIALIAVLLATARLLVSVTWDVTAQAPQPTPRAWMPLVRQSGDAVRPEWSQHGFNAQRTSYIPYAPPHPWRWRWAWNGPNASGGVSKVTGNGSLPRNVQPVTGGGRVYIAAGNDGVFALSEPTGAPLWQRSGIGDVRSTVAYDHATQAVFVVSSNGRLYKLRASDGAILGQFDSGQTSALPLPPALFDGRVVFAMGRRVHAVS
ncbi:MAG: PQQ-binding-like beta-propeller repeat protein, partial [Thermoflexales bacterium]